MIQAKEMEIYLLRHGETDYNKNRIIQGGGIDSQLNLTGIYQSDSFFKHYKKEAFNLVITSTLQRTYQTVKSFVQSNVRHEATPLINEIHWGEYEGKKGNPKMHLEYIKLTENWKNGVWDAKIKNGESANELKQRLDQFIQYIKQLSATKILVCSHGRTLKGLLAMMINQSIGEMHHYKIQNTGLSKILFKDETFTVDFINDLSHLKGIRI